MAHPALANVLRIVGRTRHWVHPVPTPDALRVDRRIQGAPHDGGVLAHHRHAVTAAFLVLGEGSPSAAYEFGSRTFRTHLGFVDSLRTRFAIICVSDSVGSVSPTTRWLDAVDSRYHEPSKRRPLCGD